MGVNNFLKYFFLFCVLCFSLLSPPCYCAKYFFAYFLL
nr:MAG TPA: vitamin D binding protein [Caudoviricetes sp.]